MHTQNKVKRLRLMSRNEPERTVRKGSIFAEAKRIVKKWGENLPKCLDTRLIYGLCCRRGDDAENGFYSGDLVKMC